MNRTARYLTKQEISKIRRLSKDHYIKEIAQKMGVSKVTIRKVQDDPRNKIVNPKRKYRVTGKYKRQAAKVIEGYFNAEEFFEKYAY